MHIQVKKSLAIISLFIVFCFSLESSRQKSDSWNHMRFHYQAKRMGMTVLEISFSVEKKEPFYLLTMTLHSTGYIRPFLQVDNLFRSYVLKDKFISLQYEKHIHQNSLFRKNRNYVDVIHFDQSASKVIVERLDTEEKREEPVPLGTLDPLALFSMYFLEYEGPLNEGIELTSYDGYHVRTLNLKSTYEDLETSLYGKIPTNCLQFQIAFTSMDEKQGDVKIWYSTDKKKYPVQISLNPPSMSEVLFNLVKVEVD